MADSRWLPHEARPAAGIWDRVLRAQIVAIVRRDVIFMTFAADSKHPDFADADRVEVCVSPAVLPRFVARSRDFPDQAGLRIRFWPDPRMLKGAAPVSPVPELGAVHLDEPSHPSTAP